MVLATRSSSVLWPQAREGRLHILGKILEAQPETREDLKPHAPRIVTLRIGKEFIGAVIGPGGKIIQGMQEKSGASISIEEVDGVGVVEIERIQQGCY